MVKQVIFCNLPFLPAFTQTALIKKIFFNVKFNLNMNFTIISSSQAKSTKSTSFLGLSTLGL